MSPPLERRPLAGRAPTTVPSTDEAWFPSPDGAPPGEDRAGRRRRARLLALGAILLAGLAAGVLALLQARAHTPTAPGTGVPPGDTTTTVERRTLVEHAQIDGTLGYGGALELYDRLSGTFTWLPSVGAVIGRGGTLFRLDNMPVALMYGSVPAYRAMKQGIGDGPDVAQLNTNLVDLGFDPYRAIAAGDHFGPATAAAVRRWQRAEGLPPTGEVELGRVLFAPGARRITAVHKALGEDPPGNGSKEPNAKQKPSKEPSGSGAGAPVLVLGTTDTQQLVQLKVKATEQQLARVGESAPVTLPNGDVVRGHITQVGTVASESSENEKEKGSGGGGSNPSGSGSGENATIAVTLALDHRVARLDKAPVSVQLVKNIRRGVLAAAASALVATAGGGYAIEALEGTRRTAITVTPGMFANGYVEIAGPGVRAGLTVIEPR